jgi:hypothetical protein
VDIAGGNFYAALTKGVQGPPIVVTRPNNVTAYVSGGVYGPGADARLQIPVPALPADAQAPGFWQIRFSVVQSRAPTDPAVTLEFCMAAAPFVTVLGDQALLALTDAEIAQLLWLQTQGSFVAAGVTAVVGVWTLNHGAGILGRRGIATAAGLPTGGFLTPGSMLGLYVWVLAAYVPAALESLTITPFFGYPAKVYG